MDNCKVRLLPENDMQEVWERTGRMKKEFIERIARVQKELKAPKSKYNSFGNYNYLCGE